MKGDKNKKGNIYRRYREVLGKPELSEEDLFKIHSFFMEIGGILYDHCLEQKRKKSRQRVGSGGEINK